MQLTKYFPYFFMLFPVQVNFILNSYFMYPKDNTIQGWEDG